MRNFTGFLVALFLSKNIQEMNLTGSGDGYGKWKLLGEMSFDSFDPVVHPKVEPMDAVQAAIRPPRPSRFEKP